MRSLVTQEALRLAWNSMRVRPAFGNWPADFDQVMADPVRSRLVSLEASHPPSPPKMIERGRRIGVEAAQLDMPYEPNRPPAVRVTPGHQQLTPQRFFDHKRAASGDRDD